jgi:hypothetical protein
LICTWNALFILRDHIEEENASELSRKKKWEINPQKLLIKLSTKMVLKQTDKSYIFYLHSLLFLHWTSLILFFLLLLRNFYSRQLVASILLVQKI